MSMAQPGTGAGERDAAHGNQRHEKRGD